MGHQQAPQHPGHAPPSLPQWCTSRLPSTLVTHHPACRNGAPTSSPAPWSRTRRHFSMKGGGMTSASARMARKACSRGEASSLLPKMPSEACETNVTRLVGRAGSRLQAAVQGQQARTLLLGTNRGVSPGWRVKAMPEGLYATLMGHWRMGPLKPCLWACYTKARLRQGIQLKLTESGGAGCQAA